MRYFKCPYAMIIFQYIFDSDDLRKHKFAKDKSIYLTVLFQMVLNLNK